MTLWHGAAWHWWGVTLIPVAMLTLWALVVGIGCLVVGLGRRQPPVPVAARHRDSLDGHRGRGEIDPRQYRRLLASVEAEAPPALRPGDRW